MLIIDEADCLKPKNSCFEVRDIFFKKLIAVVLCKYRPWSCHQTRDEQVHNLRPVTDLGVLSGEDLKRTVEIWGTESSNLPAASNFMSKTTLKT